jgi:hypothetical protein
VVTRWRRFKDPRAGDGIVIANDTTIGSPYLMRGISQLLLVHDGVVVSHGALFFLVRDAAFAARAID